MKIAVLNLQFGVRTTEGYRHYLHSSWKYHVAQPVPEEAGTFLREHKIDIAFVTEVTGAQSEVLRVASGLPYAHFFPGSARAAYDKGAAILTRYPVEETNLHPFAIGFLPRALGEVLMDCDGQKVRAFVAHLALGRRARRAQLAYIEQLARTPTEPLLIGGDFNERNALPSTMRGLALCTLPTFPSWSPRYALDALYASPAFTVHDVRTYTAERFSDHVPLVIEAALP